MDASRCAAVATCSPEPLSAVACAVHSVEVYYII